MTTPLSLALSRRQDGVPVLAVTGEVDLSNCAELAVATDQALSQSSGPLTVDLSAVAYLDSAGLNELLIRADRIEIVASPLLGPVLTVCGLTQLTAVHGLEPPGPLGTQQPVSPVPPPG
jgi:anti-sigma B factor antagonist